MNKDLQHLKILSICHYIVGGLIVAFSSLLLFYFVFGVIMIVAPASLGGPPPPPLVGWLFALIGGGGVLIGWILGIGLMFAGRFLSRRKHYLFCMVMAALVAALFHPFGTVLGVFTLIVLLRPSVKRLFETGELPYDPEEDDFRDARITSGSYNIYGER
jgi:hypothetical protein